MRSGLLEEVTGPPAPAFGYIRFPLLGTSHQSRQSPEFIKSQNHNSDHLNFTKGTGSPPQKLYQFSLSPTLCEGPFHPHWVLSVPFIFKHGILKQISSPPCQGNLTWHSCHDMSQLAHITLILPNKWPAFICQPKSINSSHLLQNCSLHQSDDSFEKGNPNRTSFCLSEPYRKLHYQGISRFSYFFPSAN